MKAHAFTRLLLMLACCFVPAGAGAQILVGLGPSPVIEFTTTPPAAEWATGDIFIIGGAGTYNSPAELDAAAQTVNVSAATMTLPATSGNGTSRFARHNTTGGYLVTQVGSSAAAVLVARLRNTSGLTLELLSISYQYSVVVFPVTDAIPGQRAFWSLTGQPGSWTLIPEFTGVTVSQPLSALLDLGAWTHDTDLYLLWVDANNGTGADGGFAIDNVVFTGGLVTPVNITDQPDDLTVPERGVAVFNVSAPGLPRDYHWLRDGVPIPGAHQSGYTNPFVVYPGDNGAVFSVIVSNYLGSQTSTGAVLTVLPDTNPPVALQVVGDFTRTTATISFSEPIDPATLDASSFQVFPTGTDPQSTGVPATTAIVANATNVVIGFAAEYAEDVNHSLVLFDVYDTAHTPNAIETTILPLHQTLQLIDFNGPNNFWSYSTETNLFGTGWETTGYDDSLWPTGPAGLGRDASNNGVPIRTAAYPFNDSAPQFFRRHFYLNAEPTNVALLTRHVFEDGAVVYLNGREAGRFNVAPGPLSVTTRTPALSLESTPISGLLPLPATNLMAGDNVIAVVVFQNGATSSDCEMALELTAIIPAYTSGPIGCLCVPEPLSQVLIEGADVTFSITASGALPIAYQWRRNGLPISGATNSSLTLLYVAPNQAGNYDVLLTNSFGHTGSVTATLIVHPADPPMFISALGSVNLTNIILTIQSYMGLDEASAENPAHYVVELTTGGGALTIESAVLTGSNVVLTTSPRLQGRNYRVTLSGVRDRSVAENEVIPATLPVQAIVVLFDYNHVWLYDQSGMNLGTAWKEPGYDDSAWPAGAGFLASEFSTEALILFTNLAGGSGSNTVLTTFLGNGVGLGGWGITYYFRTTVESLPFNSALPGNVVRATSYIDDGAAIFVNGAEVMRFNLPNPANYTNYAIATSIEGSGGLITSNLLGFGAGRTTIAAEVHQSGVGHSDVAWGMRLEGLVTTFPHVDPKVFVSSSGGNITLTWTVGGTLQHSTDLSSPMNWVNVPGSPASPFTTNASGSGTFYRVVVP